MSIAVDWCCRALFQNLFCNYFRFTLFQDWAKLNVYGRKAETDMLMMYFSGTGNSKYIAEAFSRRMGARCHSIEEQAPFSQMICEEETVAFCYPIYGSRVPKIMRDFAIKHEEPLKSKKTIIFCTQMYFSGDGARAFTDIFPKGHLRVIYAEHFLMPNNVCNVFLTPLPSEKTINKYLVNADRKMQTVCDDITNGIVRKRGFNPVSRALGLIQGIPYPALEKIAMDRVWVDKSCNGCNLCVTACPVNNFENKDGTIVTKKSCIMCYRCINICPQKAISVYLKIKVKKQYKGLLQLPPPALE
jgi:ferredoxin